MITLLDALDIPRAIFAGYDWDGRAACVAAALWPQQCAGIVSVNSYLIQDVSLAMIPIRPDLEAGFWYFYLCWLLRISVLKLGHKLRVGYLLTTSLIYMMR